MLTTRKIVNNYGKSRRLKALISNQVFAAYYFCGMVWRNFACQVIFCFFYWPAAEPLADARGTLGFCGTLVENHCINL